MDYIFRIMSSFYNFIFRKPIFSNYTAPVPIPPTQLYYVFHKNHDDLCIHYSLWGGYASKYGRSTAHVFNRREAQEMAEKFHYFTYESVYDYNKRTIVIQ